MHTTINALLGDKRNTRQALATALAERNAECEALRLELSKLRSQPTAPRALPAHFAAARELAMRTGRCVRVG